MSRPASPLLAKRLSIEQQAEQLVLEGEEAIVPSASRANVVHHVFVNPKTGNRECTCEDFAYSRNKAQYKCRHIQAFEIRVARRVDDYSAEKCEWCELIELGVSEIPSPSAPQCAAHKALNKEFGERIWTSPDHKLGELHLEIKERGLEICALVRAA